MYVGDPAKNVGMKANMVLQNIYVALNENLTL